MCVNGGQQGLELSFKLPEKRKALGFSPYWPCLTGNIFPYTQTEFKALPLEEIDETLTFNPNKLEKALNEYNPSFVLGGGGYGLVTDVEALHIDPGGDVVLELGYGGGMLEYVGNPNELIHYSVSLLIGGGGVNHIREITDTRLYSDADAFFVLEPEVNFMLNITTHFRAGVGAGYRLISGVDLAGLSDSDIGGLSINMVFKFGDY